MRSSFRSLFPAAILPTAVAATLVVIAQPEAHAQGVWHHEYFAGAPGTVNEPTTALVDKAGDIIVTGSSFVFDSNNQKEERTETAAYDREGNRLWDHAELVNSDVTTPYDYYFRLAALDSAGDVAAITSGDPYGSTALLT